MFFWTEKPVEKKKEETKLEIINKINIPELEKSLNFYLFKKSFKKVLDEYNLYAYPDMNISFNEFQLYDEVVDELNQILEPDMNLYKLIFNQVLDQIEEIDTEYIRYERNALYDNVVLEVKKNFWVIKFNRVLLDLLNNVYTFDKYKTGEKYQAVDKRIKQLIDESKEPQVVSATFNPFNKVCEDKQEQEQEEKYVVFAYNGYEFSLLGLYNSISEIKNNKSLINFANVKSVAQYIYRIIKMSDTMDPLNGFISFCTYDCNPYLFYDGLTIFNDKDTEFLNYLQN